MSDPSLALQGAMVVGLKASSHVKALVGDRVHDIAPDGVAFPYLELGTVQVIDDGAECLDAVEIYADWHVWSRAKGTVEAKRIVGAVRDVVHGAAWSLPAVDGKPWKLCEIRHRDTRVMADPDGRTTHAVLTFRALLDPL